MMPPIETQCGKLRRSAPTLHDAIGLLDSEIMRHQRVVMLAPDLRPSSDRAIQALRLAKTVLEQKAAEMDSGLVELQGVPSFKEWLRGYEKHNSPGGDFARDVAGDAGFPRSNDLDVLEWYLRSKNACEDAIDALKIAFRRYRKSVEMQSGQQSDHNRTHPAASETNLT